MSDRCKLGLRIYSKIHRAPSEQIKKLSTVGVSDVADAIRGAGVMDGGISPVYTPMRRILGSAITVDLTPGDGLMLRAAIDAAQPGDVIVANSHGECSRAILGGVIAMHMVHRGVSGLVVDGAVRDREEYRELDLPVMARAVTPRSGSTGAGWGEVNVPVACGGAVVHPGDIVMGDDEGLVVIPRLWLGEVLRGLSDTGHPSFAPGTLRDKLAKLKPDAPVLGIDRVRKAIAERDGVVFDHAYDDNSGPD